MHTTLNNIELKILTSLVSGRLSASNVNARFENNHADLASLLSKKMISFNGSYYAIALDGRAAIRKGATVISTPATIGLKDAKAMIEKTVTTESNASEKTIEKPDVLRALEYIEAHPNCTRYDLQTAGIKQPTNKVRRYVDAGFVITSGGSGYGYPKQYRLVEGLKVSDFYGKKLHRLSDLLCDGEPAHIEAIAAGLKVDVIDIEKDIKDARFDIQDIEPVIAYDSHKRLAIDEMVLTQKQTTELLAFVHELGLVG